jgi:hypothetical protein
MFTVNNGKVTDTHILQAVGLVAFVLFLTMAFQLSQVLRDRENLHDALARQDQPLENLVHIQNQLDALAVGTLNLAQKDDRNAKDIIERMKQLGINVKAPGASAPLGNQPPADAMGAPAGSGGTSEPAPNP